MTPNTATHQGFFWFGEDAEGLAVCGYTQWQDRLEAGLALYCADIQPYSLHPRQDFWAPFCFKQAFQLQEAARLCAAIAELLRTHHSLSQAIEHMFTPALTPWSRGFLRVMQADLIAGQSAAKAYKRHLAIHPLMQALIQAGLQGDQLDVGLQAASDWHQALSSDQKTLDDALRYPSLVIFSALTLLCVFVFLLLPNWLAVLPAGLAGEQLRTLRVLHDTLYETAAYIPLFLYAFWRFTTEPFDPRRHRFDWLERLLCFFWPRQMRWGMQALWCQSVAVLREAGVAWTALSDITLLLLPSHHDQQRCKAMIAAWEAGHDWLRVLRAYHWLDPADLDVLMLASQRHEVPSALTRLADDLRKRHRDWLTTGLTYVAPLTLFAAGLLIALLASCFYRLAWQMPDLMGG
jgi:type II secretory pathway component PulF